MAKRLGAVALHRHVGGDASQGGSVPAKAALGDRLRKEFHKLPAEARHLDAILWTLRPCHARLNRAEIEREVHRVIDLALARYAEQALCLVIILVSRAVLLGAAGRAEVVDRLFVDREEAHRRAVLGRHVGDGGPIRQWQLHRSLTVKLDELPDHLGQAQHLSDGQCQVGRGDALTQRALEPNADDVRRQEVNRLPKHPGLGLDAAHAPADDAQAVDHLRVRVGADQRVRIIDAVRVAQHAAREKLEVHLVHDADARRHDLERVKRLHAPLQKLVTLAVARKLQVEILVHRILRSGEVHLHRVIDHQVYRHQRLDDLWILAQAYRRRAHRCQVHQQRHAGKILQHNPGDGEWNLLRALRLGLPPGELADVLLRHLLAVTIAQHRLQNQTDTYREARDIAQAGLSKRR